MSAIVHATSCLPWLRELEAKSVDVAITDPPYSPHVHARSLSAPTDLRLPSGSKAPRKTPRKRDLGFAALTPHLQRGVAKELARVVRRWILIFTDAEGIGGWQSAVTGAGLELVRVMAWIKPNGAPQFTGDRPAGAWEAIVLAHRRGKKRWNGGGGRGYFIHPIDQRGRLHSTEKPLSLMLELVSLFSDRDELVVDPFAGSGTTGAACVRLGRHFAGCEIDPEMAAVASDRLVAESELSTVEARRRGQLPMFAAS